MSRVWLVTGSASGLGFNIAEAVLASGDRLIATARDPTESLGQEVASFGIKCVRSNLTECGQTGRSREPRHA
jgi:NAD(P)-dependent dehydrogenase (short-subunit alcohol dehydrogenase family)